LAIAADDTLRRLELATESTFALAHRARSAAAAIRARAAADKVLRGREVPAPFRVEMALAQRFELRAETAAFLL